jgi:hypothetical protein
MTEGEWGPWEWINPPMQYDTEYRTIERWEGHPVYRRIITFSNLANNDFKHLAIPAANAVGISLSGIVKSGSTSITLPFESGARKIWGYITDGKVVIFSNFDASTWSGYIEAKYHKGE